VGGYGTGIPIFGRGCGGRAQQVGSDESGIGGETGSATGPKSGSVGLSGTVSTSGGAGDGAPGGHSPGGIGAVGEQFAGPQAAAAPASSGFLASTGARIAGIAALGLALLTGGVGLLTLSRRRGRHAAH